MMRVLLIYSQKAIFSFLFLCSFISAFAQENLSPLSSFTKIDSLYREDQFYVSVTYNILKNTPEGFSSTQFSPGFSAGFLRDMPINKNRNLAIASGLGLTFNSYSQNIGITSPTGVPIYTVLTNPASYSNNKFSQLFVDVPLEFRWRGSTFENHNFFRFHTGVKLSFLLHDRSVYTIGSDKNFITSNPDFNKILYGVYVAAGYSGVNLYVHYGLNTIFNSAQVANTSIDLNSLNIGLIFYIL
jgi:hypothetical protein